MVELRVDRVGSYAQHNSLVTQMLAIEKRLMATQTQINTEKKSQDYKGIAYDSFRLVSMETEVSRLAVYQSTNKLASSRLQTTSTAIEAVDQTIRDFKSLLNQFSLTDLGVRTTDGAGPPASYTGPAPALSAEDTSKIEDIQERAFEALKSMEYYLNTSHDGRYVFAGGKTQTAPVDIPFGSLNAFQAVFDGKTVTYPGSRDTHLMDSKITGSMTFTAGATNTITAAADTFTDVNATTGNVKRVDEVAGGNLTFNAGTNSITAATVGAFNDLEAGDTIRLDLGSDDVVTNADGRNYVNEGFFTIQSVDTATDTITLAPSTPIRDDAPFNVAYAGAYTLTVPAIPQGQLSITDAGANNGTYTVADISNDGTTVTVVEAPPDSGATATNATARPDIYYKGDELTYEHRMDDSRTIEIGINAKDASFEKAIRAMALIAQGDLGWNPERIDQSLTLLSDSLDHDPALTSEQSSDLGNVSQLIGLNYATLSTMITEQEDYETFLLNRISDIENVNTTEAATRLNDDAQALEISYSAYARIMSLSLNNFL